MIMIRPDVEALRILNVRILFISVLLDIIYIYEALGLMMGIVLLSS